MAISIEERISKVEGTVTEHSRIFDMIREEIRVLREYIDGRITDTNTRIEDFREEMNRWLDETNRRIAELDTRLTSRIDATLKWIIAIQIPTWMMIITMWVTIILRIG